MFRNFLDVWNTMVHGKMWQRNARFSSRWLLIFETFCLHLNFCISFKASQGKILAHMIKYHSIFHCWNQTLNILVLDHVMCGKNWFEVMKCEEKVTKYLKLAKKFSCNYRRYFLHVQWCLIHQKNSRTSFYSWLKGFSDTSNYDRKISKQSYDTNFGTPCSTILIYLGQT